jgi:hypothetical protein
MYLAAELLVYLLDLGHRKTWWDEPAIGVDD